MTEKALARRFTATKKRCASQLLVGLLVAAGIVMLPAQPAKAQAITACTSVAGSTNLNLSQTLANLYACYNGAGAGGAVGATSRLSSSLGNVSTSLGNVSTSVASNPDGGDVQVAVAGIVRSAEGAPVSLSPAPLRVGWTLTSATDLAWVDDSTLAVVGRVSPRDVIGPQLVEIGGKITSMPPVAGTRLVTNTGGLRGVVVLTDAAQIKARAGSGWQVLQTGTDFLIPGE